MLLGFAVNTRAKDKKPLNREQTEEWKGREPVNDEFQRQTKPNICCKSGNNWTLDLRSQIGAENEYSYSPDCSSNSLTYSVELCWDKRTTQLLTK